MLLLHVPEDWLYRKGHMVVSCLLSQEVQVRFQALPLSSHAANAAVIQDLLLAGLPGGLGHCLQGVLHIRHVRVRMHYDCRPLLGAEHLSHANDCIRPADVAMTHAAVRH